MNIFLSGITGNMGKTIIENCGNNKIVGGYASNDGVIDGIPYTNKLDSIELDFDIIIDFSTKDCLQDILNFALDKKKPIVIATTGLSDEDIKRIRIASRDIPILYSQNMSVGINVLDELLKLVVPMLKNFDIEIIEKHHRNKKDAPSGTAKFLLETIKQKRNVREVYDRFNEFRSRGDCEIGISSVRGGSIVGEHSIVFAGTDEVLEINHIAQSKKIFAEGALHAAKYLVKKPNGLYSMKEAINND